jgi:hypothetical protein
MERLPYIDVHEVAVAAEPAATWRAVVQAAEGALGGIGQTRLGRALRPEPSAAAGEWSPGLRPGAALPGFEVAAARQPELLSLRGRHRFSRYRLDFEVSPDGPGRSLLRARSWAEFPGVAGAAYRALVIGSGGHRLVVRRMLRRMAAAA